MHILLDKCLVLSLKCVNAGTEAQVTGGGGGEGAIMRVKCDVLKDEKINFWLVSQH